MKVCSLQHLRKLPLDFADTVGCCPLLLNCTEQYLSQQKESLSVASDSQFSHLGRDIAATLDGNFRIKEKTASLGQKVGKLQLNSWSNTSFLHENY